MKKYVRITINPESFEGMSAEAVKSGVLRRATAQRTRAKRRRTSILVFVLALILTGFTLAMASTIGQEAYSDHETTEKTVFVIHAANPQSEAMWNISDDEKALVEKVVMSTARGEDDIDAMQAVAQAIRNSCEDFSMTVNEVVEKNKWPTDYQGDIDPKCTVAVESVINGYYAVDGRLHYACNVASADAWHEKAVQSGDVNYVCQIGSLRFYE